MKRLSLLLFVIGCCSGVLPAQTLIVYPGDVTDNGEVNNLDFLQIGMAYNFAGPARDSATQAFVPLPVLPWSYEFAGGQNMAYADCNGDGIVNYYYDAFPLYTNYGQRRSANVQPDVFLPGLPGIDPPLRFNHSGVPPVVHGGEHLQIPIELGTDSLPAEDVYGVAFSMFVDPQVVDPNSVMFNLSETSWANPDNDRIWMFKKVSNQRLDAAWVRTDRNQKRGFGKIGYVDFVIIVDVVPLQAPVKVTLENIRLMDKFGNYSLAAGDTLLLATSENNPSGVQNTQNEPLVALWPNPTARKVILKSAEPITGLSLTDLLGRQCWSDASPRGTEALVDLPELPDGPYLLRIETEKGVVFRRLQILQP